MLFPAVRSWLELIREKVSISFFKFSLLSSLTLKVRTTGDVTRAHLELTFTPLSSNPPGRSRVWDVGPRCNRHLRGPANCWCPVRHQNHSPQKEEPQPPEEEDQTTGGRCLPSMSPVNNLVSFQHFSFFSATWRNWERQSGPGHAARRQLRRRVLTPTPPTHCFFFKRPILYRTRGGEKKEKETSVSLWQPCLHPPKAVWLWLIWYSECDSGSTKVFYVSPATYSSKYQGGVCPCHGRVSDGSAPSLTNVISVKQCTSTDVSLEECRAFEKGW